MEVDNQTLIYKGSEVTFLLCIMIRTYKLLHICWILLFFALLLLGVRINSSATKETEIKTCNNFETSTEQLSNAEFGNNLFSHPVLKNTCILTALHFCQLLYSPETVFSNSVKGCGMMVEDPQRSTNRSLL